MPVPKPMLATLAPAPLVDSSLVYEPKYDGIRAIVEVGPPKAGSTGRRRGGGDVRIWSRNGNEKTAQFPVIADALRAWASRTDEPLVLDGEIVALDAKGRPAGFQQLQGRIHLSSAEDVRREDRAHPAALIVFDLLREGTTDLTRRPLTDRRARLEARFQGLRRDGTIRVSEQVRGDARRLYDRAKRERWEGLIAKEAASTYQPGRRTPAWRKIKLQHEQEFVVGGWTEPRHTRQYFGALLLGVFEGNRLVYVGHTGTGFDQKELARVSSLLKARETSASPFAEAFKTNEPAHWVRPELVAEIRFTEWTADHKLRHPVYLGLRDDKPAREVVREEPAAGRARTPSDAPARRTTPHARPTTRKARRTTRSALRATHDARRTTREAPDPLIERLRELEDARRDGELTLPDGSRVAVTNLAKPFWPALKLTKGDLLRYYVAAAPYILPAIEDRPLVMKRFPNGVAGKAFYQHRSRDERPPAGVRIETLPEELDPIHEADARRFVGGSLTTLLYMTQLAAISQDPWFSRVASLGDADYVALDLDPTEGTPFTRVLEVARWLHDELQSLAVPAFPKTSGSRGLHIYVPLPPHTSYESGLLFCQIVATVVSGRHPKAATVERAVARRPRGTVYVDFLQNIPGKTLATAHSARASDYAGVSTPLEWREVHEGLDPRDFTIRTAPARFEAVGDLWAGLRSGKAANLDAVFRKYR